MPPPARPPEPNRNITPDEEEVAASRQARAAILSRAHLFADHVDTAEGLAHLAAAVESCARARYMDYDGD